MNWLTWLTSAWPLRLLTTWSLPSLEPSPRSTLWWSTLSPGRWRSSDLYLQLIIKSINYSGQLLFFESFNFLCIVGVSLNRGDWDARNIGFVKFVSSLASESSDLCIDRWIRVITLFSFVLFVIFWLAWRLADLNHPLLLVDWQPIWSLSVLLPHHLSLASFRNHFDLFLKPSNLFCTSSLTPGIGRCLEYRRTLLLNTGF
jgi:hypothetical protein